MVNFRHSTPASSAKLFVTIFSSFILKTSEVPQGPILGPLLFLLCQRYARCYFILFYKFAAVCFNAHVNVTVHWYEVTWNIFPVYVLLVLFQMSKLLGQHKQLLLAIFLIILKMITNKDALFASIIVPT